MRRECSSRVICKGERDGSREEVVAVPTRVRISTLNATLSIKSAIGVKPRVGM